MAESAPQPTSHGSKRRLVLVRLGAFAGFLVLVVFIAGWVVHWYVAQPQTIALTSNVATTRPSASTSLTTANVTFTGHVIDAQTNEPIKEFTARLGFSGDSSPSNFVEPIVEFKDGTYRLTASIRTGATAYNSFVRIEAHGYLPAVSPPLAVSTIQDFQLYPGQDLQGHIFGPNGKPVAGATVAVALGGLPMVILNGTISKNRAATHVLSEADGHYNLFPQSGAFTVFVLSDAGYAEADQDALAKNPDIHLVPWAQIDGRLLDGTKPGANKDLSADNGHRWAAGAARILHSMTSTSDAQGRFHFDRFPPGPGEVVAIVPITKEGKTNPSVYSFQKFTATAGQSISVTIGGVGRTVIGRVILPSITAKWPGIFIGGNITSTDFQLPPEMPESIKNGSIEERLQWMQQFSVTPAGREYLNSHPEYLNLRYYPAVTYSDGTFSVANVVPGNYHIKLSVQRLGSYHSIPATADFTMPPIPGGVSDEPLVIPDIDLH